ncbi:unnamed protein product [Calypogeia fissa]
MAAVAVAAGAATTSAAWGLRTTDAGPSSSSSWTSFPKQHRAVALSSSRVRLPWATPVVSKAFILPDLPYPMDALEPHISKQTLEFHWGKHHRAYVDNLNKQIENTDLERNTLDEIVKISYNNGNPSPAFNNAGQAWNHDFYWLSMKPGGGGEPGGELTTLIERDFGSYETFLAEFKQAATTQFGSGWAWLVANKAKLEILKTPNAINPLIWGQVPLLVIDVWEHAYYLDFQNRRVDYVNTFMNSLVNWDAAEERLARAKTVMNFGEPKIPAL